MDTIIFTAPYLCDDKQCAYDWHMATYHALDQGGYAVDTLTDGDFEDVTEQEFEAELAAAPSRHTAYAQWVLEHGADPLGEFTTPRTRKVRERWEFRWTKSLVGARCTLIRRNSGTPGTWRPPFAPVHVREYLGLNGANVIGSPVEDLPRLGYPADRWNVIHIDCTVARSPITVSRELRKVARRYLKAAA